MVLCHLSITYGLIPSTPTDLKVDIPLEFHELEIVCADLYLNGQSFRIIGYYRSGGFDKEAIDYMQSSVKCFSILCSTKKNVVILGDFNLPDIDWHYHHGPDSVIHNSFLHFINRYSLTQHVDQPTQENSILDLILSSSSSFISNLCIKPPIGTSDHNVIIFTPNLSCLYNKTEVLVQQFFCWKNADYQVINKYLKSVDWMIIFQTCFNIEACWHTFSTLLNNIITLHVLKVRVCEEHKLSHKIHYPYYVKRLINNKAMAWKRSKVTGKPNDKAAYKLIAAQCSDSIRKYHAAKELKMIRKDNLGSFFNFVNGKLKTCCKLNDIRRSDNTLCHDKEEISFEKALGALKPTTSTGLDGIPNVFLKNCANSLSNSLSHLFDTSFKDGAIPLDWKVASVIPIHKKGPAVDPVSHSKLLMKLPAYGIVGNLLNWLTNFLHMRSQVVNLNNITSHAISVKSGVPQGSVLGPTLFLLFINDVSHINKQLDIKLKLFADDIKLYSVYDVRGLQSDLHTAVNRLYEWSCNLATPNSN
ncbi:uncharacterized protein LOC124811182 [Hydra vulgaris]|uniref:uncharacterized protein LOC124811182 n=1 Tax=Hydra vulgaris TaxID=6087 RepID=UPI0032EA7405